MTLDLPAFFWSLPVLRHPSKVRLADRRRDNFFVARPVTYDSPFAACSIDIHPRLHGQERRLKKTPSANACKKCLRAWRDGWGSPR